MRILIAGTNSGCGKTTATIALMAALRAKGLTVAPFKVGPDYIDPGFHKVACGHPSHNLDGHLCDTATVRALLREGEERADIAVIEGVMGYYDGMNARDFACSTWKMACDTQTPALLVVDTSGGAASAAATALGFFRFKRSSGLAGSAGEPCVLLRALRSGAGSDPCVCQIAMRWVSAQGRGTDADQPPPRPDPGGGNTASCAAD